ncbi:MAG TPA: translation elongation factor Ts [Abditibacteriaceae bacterium]|jgi:elongation factor Ts
MATVDAASVKRLREMTSAGIMDCKGALAETNGDFDAAAKLLREKGIASAAKKADRTAADGMVGVSVAPDGKRAALVEVNCETDFVARNEKFQELANGLAEVAQQGGFDSVEGLMAQQVGGKPVDEAIKEAMATLGENIVVARVAMIESEGTIGAYVHTDGKQAALVNVVGGESAGDIARDVAMQAVALKAPYLNRESVPADVVEGEKHIYRQQAAGEGKPEAMLDKIAEGRLNKFYQQNTLVEQPFIKDDKKSVQQVVKAGNGDVAGFVRFKVGEGS